MFDGKPEAIADVEASAADYRAVRAKERQRLAVPAATDEASKLAARYSSATLGKIQVERQAANIVFHFNGWKSTVASRKMTMAQCHSLRLTQPAADSSS